jgi:hypothetical protein
MGYPAFAKDYCLLEYGLSSHNLNFLFGGSRVHPLDSLPFLVGHQRLLESALIWMAQKEYDS